MTIAFRTRLNFLWLLSFFQEKESNMIETPKGSIEVVTVLHPSLPKSDTCLQAPTSLGR
jgi:hypothetical protein